MPARNINLKQRVRQAVHALLRLVAAFSTKKDKEQIKRILLINGAHLGDVVIATSLLPVLKSAFPDAEIGFLTASWSQAAVRNHPDITYFHRADHWRMNRETPGFLRKRLQYWKTRRQALREIRSLSYDLSISMHPWRADFLPLAWQAGIPERVAFSGGLWAPLATVLADYPEDGWLMHQSECQALLLRKLGIDEEHLRKRQSSLGPSSDDASNEVWRLLGLADPKQASYSVIHMGAGVPAKEPPVWLWRELAASVSANQRVLFTGKGTRESSNAAQAMTGLSNCVNACGKLSWDGFVAAIRHAETFYGVDSMASHVAAATGTKCVALYGGMNTISRWRPESKNSVVWSNALPCSPCQRQYGCAAMSCMEGFVASDILQIQ